MIDVIPSGRRPRPAMESASPALLRPRALAIVLDLVVSFVFVETVVLAGVVWLVPEWTPRLTGLFFVGSAFALAPIYLTYAFFFEWRFGQTPGKVWQELVVTTTDGDPPGLLAAATRNLLRYVDWLPACFLLGWFVARRSPAGQRLGDRLSGTVVVRAAGAHQRVSPTDGTPHRDQKHDRGRPDDEPTSTE